uniref:Ribosomal protein L15 n=1 Tax=Haemonchus placei TaxID=6290 RepID=A0A0N4WYP7_HAEPC
LLVLNWSRENCQKKIGEVFPYTAVKWSDCKEESKKSSRTGKDRRYVHKLCKRRRRNRYFGASGDSSQPHRGPHSQPGSGPPNHPREALHSQPGRGLHGRHAKDHIVIEAAHQL